MFWKKSKKQAPAGASVSGESPPAGGEPPKSNKPKKHYYPLEVKLMAIDAREAGLSALDISKIVGASRITVEGWYREWRKRGRDAFIRTSNSPKTRGISKLLEAKIVEHRRENPDDGVRRIRDELHRNEAIKVSAETVRNVVNEAGLGNPAPVSKKRPEQIRRFERELPNAMWQTDIFTFELKRMYKVYLIGFIDDHSRYMVAHGLFRQQTSEAVMEVLRAGIGQWGAPREILSDNGRQYASWKGKTQFQKTLRREGIQHVRSAPHHPMTLGKIERFWKTIWTEFLEDAVFASFADARQRIDHWIGYYNHQRPHQGIDGACPADRFYGIAGDVEAALAQGCKENALQLALGQETSPPLYLLGKLGDTDVRVTRRGDEIEMKLGDTVHETIKMGAPFEIGSEETNDDALEEHDGRGTLSSAGAGEGRQEAGEGDLCDLRSEQTDAVPDAGESGESGDGSAGTEEAGAQTEERGGPADYRAFEDECVFGGREGAVEDEV